MATKVSVTILPSLRPNLPNVLASATVSLETDAGLIQIHDCRILLNKNGIQWFAFPTFSIQHAARQFEYKQTIELAPALAQRISTEALWAYEAWAAKQPTPADGAR